MTTNRRKMRWCIRRSAHAGRRTCALCSLFLSPSPAENEIHSLTLITAYKALHALASSSTSPIFSSVFLNITHIPAAVAFFLTLRGQTLLSQGLYMYYFLCFRFFSHERPRLSLGLYIISLP